ncbi:MAG: methyltransferase domain-containing protein [Cyanomargarita calcarea GSE-NOS-MK-12-04C]|jgi:ubiquinone/menaquinone biosynthesis C-methylase UbiE|uniref:Methyltransferase domain-containing protein n=1 Tax=Cyanomargarita calcarea GSE-NOS-MK-12-04C TaxID=2839659 RepID=A0A951UTY9_9CYAN|nr:methyltransferase domain-containing protein [Cyanomargarita calcarea GSE-NOS-MK-12-04C]
MKELMPLIQKQEQEQGKSIFSQYQKLNIPLATCDDRLLWETWMSMFHFPTLTVADELGLFSFLDKRPNTASDIAKSFSLGDRATEAILGVMTSLGYLVQQDGKFNLTEASRNFLLPESPYYWGGMLKLMANNPLSHSTLLEALKNDKSSVYKEQDVWETHEVEPEKAKLFTSAMQSMTMPGAAGAAKHGDFTDVKRLLDVGGGSAAVSVALAKRYPNMHCTILDLPVVCSIAEEYISQAELSHQIDTYEGNFFTQPFPNGYDAILFSNIFHDWTWEKCLHLAKQSFEALPKGGRIYLHEVLLSDTKDTPLVATSYSMCMVWWTQGKQFTAGELTKLLLGVGFEDVSVTPTHSYYSLIYAVKP